jgi:hypothetical protein
LCLVFRLLLPFMFSRVACFFFRDSPVITHSCVSGLRWDTSVFARIGGLRSPSLQALSTPIPAKISASNSMGWGHRRTGASPVPTMFVGQSGIRTPGWGFPLRERGVPTYPLRRGRYDGCTPPLR